MPRLVRKSFLSLPCCRVYVWRADAGQQRVLISPFLFALLPAHVEFLLIGWTVQLAMGLVFWIVPRFSGKKPQGHLYLIVLAFWLLNLGVGLVALQPYAPLDWLTFAGRSMELMAVVGFVIGTWKRIKPHGR